MNNLEKILDSNKPIILDGAVGNGLQEMGVPMDDFGWCASALKTHPSKVKTLHEEYIKAGADIITTNTYASCNHNLQAMGLGDETEQLNTLAVHLAKEAVETAAVDKKVWIAGSLSSFGVYNVSRGDRNLPPISVIEDNYKSQAYLLAEAGVDFILLEMVRESIQGSLLLKAAEATGLPVWVGVSCSVNEQGDVKMLSTNTVTGASDLDCSDTLGKLMSIGGSLLAIMHTEIEHTTAALQVALKKWTGPVAAYPNSGHFYPMKHNGPRNPSGQRPNGGLDLSGVISPADYLAYTKEWIKMGVQVVGGCCGIGLDHIRALNRSLNP